jgi:hypothetical protein
MTNNRAVRDFFSPHGKNLSPYGKFNDNDAKHKQKSAILSVRDTAYDNLFIFCWRIYRAVRKISHRINILSKILWSQ